MTVFLVVVGGVVVWLLAAFGVARLFGAVIRMRDRQAPPLLDVDQPLDEEGQP